MAKITTLSVLLAKRFPFKDRDFHNTVYLFGIAKI